MIAANLFRALPSPSTLIHADNDDDDVEMFNDPEWPHLHLIYEILIHLVLSPQIDNNLRKRLIDDAFLQNLVLLFDSFDMHERECLKTVTHRIYGKLTNRRVTIRKLINYIFYEFLYERKEHNGIAELLEILASIINGFTVPIRDEHKKSLEKSLIPLHKMRSFETYSIQLSYCMTLYVAKDSSLSTLVGGGVDGVVRFYRDSIAISILYHVLTMSCRLSRIFSNSGHSATTPRRPGSFRKSKISWNWLLPKMSSPTEKLCSSEWTNASPALISS